MATAASTPSTTAEPTEACLPVAAARLGFTPEQVAGFHAARDWRDVLRTGDASLYLFLRFAEFYPAAAARRFGTADPLPQADDPRVGAVCLPPPDGRSLDAYLADPASRAQGLIVVRRGSVAYERYPGMREDDAHVTMSVAKTMPALVVGILAEAGRVDLAAPVGACVPALAGSAWDGVRLADALAMNSGLDVEETAATRDDPRSTFGRFLRSTLGVPAPDGGAERPLDVVRSARRLREPGRRYEYSSVNTQVLAMAAEAAERRPWAEVFRDRVWSHLRAEGDADFLLAADGTVAPYGLGSMRLRDLARYGMLYTPSWERAARRPVVPAAVVEQVRAGRPAGCPPGPPPAGGAAAYSSWQWDWVDDHGGFYKGGLHGQGLYVSPADDLVVAWFSTAAATELPRFALAVRDLFGERELAG